MGWISAPQLCLYQSQQLTNSLGLHRNNRLFDPIVEGFEIHLVMQYMVNAIGDVGPVNIWQNHESSKVSFP